MVKGSGVWVGKALFVISTSALLLGVPWALAFAEEQQYAEMEQEMKSRESGQEVRYGTFSVHAKRYENEGCARKEQWLIYLIDAHSRRNCSSSQCAIKRNTRKGSFVRRQRHVCAIRLLVSDHGDLTGHGREMDGK